MPTIDWTSLETSTNQLRTLSVRRDPAGRITDVVFSGLRVKLSELVQGLTSDGATSLAVWADTLVIDYPTFNTLGTVVVARSLDTSALGGESMPIRVPTGGKSSIAEFLVKETVDGKPFGVAIEKSGTLHDPFAIPLGSRPPRVAYYTVTADGKGVGEVKTDAAEFNDLLSRPFALNSLKASFTAAMCLMDSPQASDRNTAKSMLEWVVTCLRAAGDTGALGNDFAELGQQAASLLVSLNVASGAYYIPALSTELYRSDVSRLLSVLSSYEDNLRTLDVRTDIKAAIESVSATLAQVANDEKLPSQTELDNIDTNTATLAKDMRTLRLEFDLRNYEAQTNFVLMQAKIASAQVKQFLVACFGVVVSVTKAGVQAGAAVASGGTSEIMTGGVDVFDSLTEAAQHGYEAIDTISTDYSSEPLPNQARDLIKAQEQLSIAIDTSARLWAAARDSEALAKLPDALAAVTVDPSLAWDNYMVEADRTLTNLQRLIGSGTGSGDAQDAATNYLASLKILAQYGKAIAAKFVAYSALLSRATIVKAQLTAAANTQKRWDALKKQASSEEEMLAGLKGLIVTRTDAIKRSTYVAWWNYRNAFFYLNFVEPTTRITPQMNAAQLKDAFAAVAAWTERLLVETGSSNRIRLPNENVPIEIPFKVVRQQTISAGDEGAALLVLAAGDQPATLSLSLDLSDPRLIGKLPNRGNVAVWVTEAAFYFKGVKPNTAGKVLLNVATSGSYQNGFGATQAHSFVTTGFESYFGYDAAQGTPYIRWRVDTKVYMTPRPFTQWTITFDPDGGDPSGITELRMDMTGASLAKT
jgi:hypothetical protein